MDTLTVTQEKFSILELKPRHEEMALRIMLGQKDTDIAAELGCTPQSVGIVKRSPLFKLHLKKLIDARRNGAVDIQKQLDEFAPAALDTVARTMFRGTSERIKLDSAQDLLDRAGHGRTSKTKIDISGRIDTTAMTPVELQKLVIERVKRINSHVEGADKALAEAECIEVQYEDVESKVEPDKDRPDDGREEPNNIGGYGKID